MTEEPAKPTHIVGVNDKLYWLGPKGELVPDAMVGPKARLADDTTRDWVGRAEALSAEMRAFKQAAFADVDAYCALVFQRYGANAAGEKGNLTIFTFDGLQKVVVQVQNRLVFGDEIQAAKALIDECVAEWSVDSRPEIQALINNAFRTDSEGQLNRYAILGLRQLDIEEPRWRRAMQAIADSEKVVGSSRYIRFYKKAAGQDRWDNICLDLASV